MFAGERSPEPLQGHRHWFSDAVREAGLKEFHWHDLRHDFASRLVMQGVNLRAVQILMGHKSIQTTCRYAHLAPKDLLDAEERLNLRRTKSPTDTGTSTRQKGRSAVAGRNVA